MFLTPCSPHMYPLSDVKTASVLFASPLAARVLNVSEIISSTDSKVRIWLVRSARPFRASLVLPSTHGGLSLVSSSPTLGGGSHLLKLLSANLCCASNGA